MQSANRKRALKNPQIFKISSVSQQKGIDSKFEFFYVNKNRTHV